MAQSKIEAGKKAPAFTLPNQDGDRVSLADFAGRWVVLYFYPKDDTPGCTVEACDFTSGLRQFERLDTAVLGCSPDNPESHRRFIKKHGLRITLLSDEKKTVMTKYGAWGEKTMYGRKMVGVIRSTTLIGPDGKIAWHWPKVRAAGHAEKVQAKLKELQEAR